jgi:hypothetical protein
MTRFLHGTAGLQLFSCDKIGKVPVESLDSRYIAKTQRLQSHNCSSLLFGLATFLLWRRELCRHCLNG